MGEGVALVVALVHDDETSNQPTTTASQPAHCHAPGAAAEDGGEGRERAAKALREVVTGVAGMAGEGGGRAGMTLTGRAAGGSGTTTIEPLG